MLFAKKSHPIMGTRDTSSLVPERVEIMYKKAKKKGLSVGDILGAIAFGLIVVYAICIAMMVF